MVVSYEQFSYDETQTAFYNVSKTVWVNYFKYIWF